MAERGRPHVLLVISDQQRADTLGFRGRTVCRTPHMDRLAREGTSLDRAMTPCPLCLPARASLFTGRYPHENDMLDNATSALEECRLLDTFRTAGYATSYAGKWHLGEDNIERFTDRAAGDDTRAYSAWCAARGLVDGWTFNDPRVRTHRTPSMSTPAALPLDMPPETTNDAYIGDIALEQLRTRDRGRPFFQVCAFNGPHPPFVIPEPFFSMYRPGDIVEAPNFGPQPGEPDVNRRSYYRQLFLDHGADFDAWRESWSVYLGFVSLIDAQLGRLLAELDAQGVADDTVVVFLSDHGENLGAHGLWHKMVAYEESIRVPLLLRWPGRVRAAVRSDAPVSLIDVAPTLAALCGIDTGGGWRGLDLSAALAGEAEVPANRPLFALHRPLGEWMGTEPWRMIERERHKLVWHLGGERELFDLRADPYELNDLSTRSTHAGTRRDLERALLATMRDCADPLTEALAEAVTDVPATASDG